ncbi:MAG: phage portal protein [Ruminococcus sp.]|nr:phage portal protein [Ruminococcus sp.]
MKFLTRLKTAARAIFKGSVIQQDLDNWHELATFLGIDAEHTPKKALSNATYFACLKMLSEAIGKMPLKVLVRKEKNGVREERENPYWKMLHDRPNRYMSAACFWSLMEYNRNHYGNCYAWILYDPKTKHTELYPLEPWLVELWFDNALILADTPQLWYRYSAPNGRVIMIPYDSILHMRNFATSDGLTGKSVRTILAETIDGNVKAQTLLNKMYDNGFAGKAAIQYTGELSDDLEKRFIKGIEKYLKGEYKNDGIEMLIPLPYMAKIENLSNVKLADTQFLELKQYSAIQIAAAFGIKPIQIGDYTKSSYANSEAQQLAFLVDTLLFIVKQYEDEINYKLLDGSESFAKFNVDVILRADFKTKIETLRSAIYSGQMTINEARAIDDREALPGGDDLIVNGATIYLKDVGKQYQRKGVSTNEKRDDSEDSVGRSFEC